MFKGLFALAALTLVAQAAHAAGYEKSIMWGGKTGSVAGISASYIEGADALYFNPAGLVAKAPGSELSLNVSPVWSKFSGPYDNQNDVVDSKQGFSAPLGLIYSNTLNDQWAFGVGGYISGGSKVEFENIPYAEANHNPSTKTDLQIGEISAGVAWKPTSAWKFGAAYRYVMARANFAFFQRSFDKTTFAYNGILNAQLNDLKDQESAFKLGAQWAPSETWHVGLTYRSEVNLNASGSIDGTFYAAGGTTTAPITHADASAATTFPQAVTLGVDHDFSDTWKGFAEAAWTNYARVDKIQTTTSTNVGGSTTNTIVNPYITQNWKDQWNFRLGAAYTGWSWPVRFGYGLTTQVTNSDWARPTFTPPGTSHTLTIGSGHQFEVASQKFEFNGAGEYTFVTGDGNGQPAGGAPTINPAYGATQEQQNIRAGTYKTSSVALHLGLAYNF